MNRTIFAAFAVWGLLATAFALPSRADEEAIRESVASYVEAFNQKNLDTVGRLWAAKATHIDRETGEQTEGREAIRADIAAVFQERPEIRLSAQVDRVRLIKPDVASIQGTTLVSGPEVEPSSSVFSAILVKENDAWVIDTLEESPVPQPATPYEGLQELEWMVGHWVDASETVRVDTNVRWSSNQAFLIRSYVAQDADGPVFQGTQVIGWDPRAQQIRSWKFDADGSFGDAIWSHSDNSWLIRSTQTLADSRAASGTFVITKVDENTMTVQLIGHEIEGEPQPSGDPVTVVRAAESSDDAAQQATEPQEGAVP